MQPKSIDRIFWEAAQIAGVAERQAYLDQICGDGELRRKVEQLLQAQPKVESFLESPPALLGTVDEHPLSERPGTVIGPYKLLEQIGEGGFGIVFTAEQLQPVRRKVALKVLKPGMDTRQVIARFEAERQALALMDHPNIAKVLDGGATASGRPYFVMELVRGVPITEFCDQNHLTHRQRLGLFVPVCQAVQHAHQKGVIHRDLKPSNVLVTLYDGTPVVKVIDFGVAKALGPPLTDKTLFTGFAQLIGTPLYMSPEQAELSGLDVDTRSDIYALGVLLYELLTGVTPFDKERLRRAGYDEVRRIIREEEPPKPSTRVSTLGQTASGASAQRKSDPRGLSRLLRGELDWVVMKALEKDCNRRYETANAFAMDVQRYLADEPVQACPPSAGYRFRKFVRRNRPAVVFAGVLLLATVGLAVSLTLAYQESRTADRIRKEQQATQEALRQAKDYRYQAERLSTSLALERSLALLDQQEVGRGMLWLTHGLRIAPAEAADLQHTIRLNLAAFHHQLRYQLRMILEQEGEVKVVALSPDEQSLLIGGSKGLLYLRDVTTGAPIGEPFQHPGEVRTAAFSPDGRTLLTGGADKTARLWETATRRPLSEPLQHGNWVQSAAFSPDGMTVVTGCADYTARLWEVATGKPVGEPLRHGGWVQSVAFSPDGKTVLTGDVTGVARLWDPATGKVLLQSRRPSEVWAVAFNPKHGTVLTGNQDGIAQLWEAGMTTPIGLPLRHQGPVLCVGFSPDGTTAWTGSADGNVRVWDAGSARMLGMPIQHQSAVQTVAVSAGQKLVVSGCVDGKVRVWEAIAGKALGLSLPHKPLLYTVAFSPDGRTIATGGADGTVHFWEAATGQPVGKPLGHPKAVYAVAFSPDGKAFLTASGGEARLWDAATRESVGRPLRHQGSVFAAAFSPDGKTLVTGSSEGSARRWDVATGNPVGAPLQHPHIVHAVSFSPDGRTILTGCEDGIARFWDAATDQPRGKPLLHRGPIRAVAFSPDGKAALTGAWGEATARLWDAASGEPLGPPLQHPDSVTAVAFSPDSKVVAVGSWDGTARLWDVATGKPLGPPLRHERTVRALAFSPDGQALLTGSFDRTAKLWRVPTSVSGDVGRITLWVQVLTGLELDPDGLYRVLDAPTWQQRRRLLEEWGGPPLL